MRFNANCTLNCVDIHGLSIGEQVTALHCTAVQRVSIVKFDWTFEIRDGKLMRIMCVFNAFSTQIRQRQIRSR